MSVPMFAIVMLITLALLVLFLVLMFVASFLMERLPSREKSTAFECGFSSFSDAYGPFNVQYYFTALYFLVFDLELALLIPVIPILPAISGFGMFFFLFFMFAMFLCVFYERLAFSET